jgi:chromosome segregation ATPase
MLLKSGKYRFAEVAQMFHVSRTTAEKYPERYGAPETTVLYNGREVSGIELTHELIETISKDRDREMQGGFIAKPSQNETLVKEESHGNDALIIELRNRINGLENVISQLEEQLQEEREKVSGARDTISELRATVATLEADARASLKELESHSKLVDQYEARLQEKDKTISSLEAQVQSERSKADSFNNQIRGLNDKLQTTRNSSTNGDIERWMEAAYEKQKHEIAQMLAHKLQIEVKEAQKIQEKKGFRLFGIEISRSKNQ